MDVAIAVIEKALDSNNKNPDLWYRLAGYLYNSGKVQQAYVFIEKALEMDSSRYTELLAYLPELENESRFIELLEIYNKSK